MNISSAYLFGRQISLGQVPPPYKPWWWNSPGVFPVQAVNGFLPYCDKDTFFYDVFYYVAGINEDYSGHDIGCDAFEITQTLPWGYDKAQHSGNPSYSVAFIPLMDKNTGQKSNDRLMLEMAWNKCLPYVDANDPGLYDVDLSMWIYTEQGQYLPLHQNGKKSAIGIFKPDGVHVYMVAGVDTLRKADDSLELDMVYGGLIQDVGYGNGSSCVRWDFCAYKLVRLYNYDYIIDTSWYDPPTP